MEREEEASLTPAQLIQLAETHLRLRNFSLCRQYALESQQPNDPNHHHNHLHSSRLLAVADILSAATAAASPTPTNFYSILQVDTFSDDHTLIRAQFKNLLLLLNPIKDKFPLANEAINLVWKAYNGLSNSTQKAQLDSQLAILFSNQKHINGGAGEGESSAFWTFCPYCFYMYQYARVYEGCCLRCQNETCRRAFHGVSLTSLPRMELDKGQYFGCFGYFPMGFSPSETEGEGRFASWSPIVGMFPMRRMGKTRAGRIDLNDDNDYVEISDESDESESPPQYDNEGQQQEARGENFVGQNVGKSRMKRKSVAWNAKKLMGRGRRSNDGANGAGGGSFSDEDGGDGDGDEGELYGFEDNYGVGAGSGFDIETEDMKFFEGDGEIFVGLGPDDGAF